MDRDRLIAEIQAKGIDFEDTALQVMAELGRGGNGVALRCHDPVMGDVVAKVYIPPDKRDLDGQSLARFEAEVRVTSRFKHPYVMPSLGDGELTVGAYRLPFYLMPLADATLRDRIGGPPNPDEIPEVAGLIIRTCLGVCALHSHSIVHRDLKPENILMTDSRPRIADLGIAHVSPEFVSVSLKTIASERLLNRDYYAPEQRFGAEDDVDHRADIYALGCIIYELVCGTPPVRKDAPALGSLQDVLAPLDPVIDRMTAYAPEDRYAYLEEAVADLGLALGHIDASVRGYAPPPAADTVEMAKLLRSTNAANRRRGVVMAGQLGAPSLPILFELMGHTRRDIRNSAAQALEKVGDESAIPYLVGGLCATGSSPSSARPNCDTAGAALKTFSIEARRSALQTLDGAIRPQQALDLVDGMDDEQAFGVIKAIRDLGLLYLDWVETGLEPFIAINESMAWPLVEAELDDLSGYRLARLMGYLSTWYRFRIAERWVERHITDTWDVDTMTRAIVNIDDADPEAYKELLLRLETKLKGFGGSLRARDALRAAVSRRLSDVEG